MGSHEQGNGKVLFWTLFGVTTFVGGLIFWPFLSALLWAAVLAVLMWPFYSRLRKRFSMNFSALMATMVTGVVIVLPFAALGTVAGLQAYGFAHQLMAERAPGDKTGVTIEQIATKLDEMTKPVLSQIGLSQQVDVKEYVESHKADITAAFPKIVFNLGYTILTLVMALVTMFFILRDGPRLLDPACELVPLPPDETKKIIGKMQSTIQSVFVGVVLVSGIQAMIAGVAYWILGVQWPLLWAFVTFVFCTIPMLGAPVVYVPLSIKLIADGHIPQALGLLIVGFGVISVIDNFLRPVFIGARSDLHPMAIFFSLLGGVVAIGPIGIMAGPMIVTLLLALTDVLRARRRLEDERLAVEVALG